MSVQSVKRAFLLLEAIAHSPSSLTELARRVNLPVSTTSRLLSTLESLNAVERIENSALYRIGAEVATLGATVDAASTLAAVARPELERLTDLTGEASGISVSAGSAMHFLDQVDADQSVQVRSWTGTRVPMHLVAAGFAVMTFWSDEAIDNYLERTLERTTEASLTEPDAIRARLAEVYANGVAWTFAELEEDINAAAAPVLNYLGEVVCAIHVHGPAYRFPGDDREKIAGALLESADVIAHSIGTTDT